MAYGIYNCQVTTNMSRCCEPGTGTRVKEPGFRCERIEKLFLARLRGHRFKPADRRGPLWPTAAKMQLTYMQSLMQGGDGIHKVQPLRPKTVPYKMPTVDQLTTFLQVTALAFSPSDKRLAVCTVDRSVMLSNKPPAVNPSHSWLRPIASPTI